MVPLDIDFGRKRCLFFRPLLKKIISDIFRDTESESTGNYVEFREQYRVNNLWHGAEMRLTIAT